MAYNPDWPTSYDVWKRAYPPYYDGPERDKAEDEAEDGLEDPAMVADENPVQLEPSPGL